jgi:hypothetical protein
MYAKNLKKCLTKIFHNFTKTTSEYKLFVFNKLRTWKKNVSYPLDLVKLEKIFLAQDLNCDDKIGGFAVR